MNEKDVRELVANIIKEIGNLEAVNEGLPYQEAKGTGGGHHDSGNKGIDSGNINHEGIIPDIRQEDYRTVLEVENPVHGEEFLKLKANTDARLGIGRCGPRYKTKAYLRILADNAGALDAVLNEVPEDIVARNNLFPVQTLCENKDIYLTRPDLGRQFSQETKEKIRQGCLPNSEVQIIVSEGLSSTAMERNIDDLLASLEQGLSIEGIKSGTPIYVKYSRVPAMDVITEVLNPKVTIILIGERPGLSTYASLSAYITYEGKVGMAEVGRTVVSNIHENGTNPVEAGAHIATLAKKMLEQKISGAGLKQ